MISGGNHVHNQIIYNCGLYSRGFGPDYPLLKDRWFFTANEIADAYRYQQQFGARLRNPLEAQTCFEGKPEFAASHQGKRFVAPCRFVEETIRQLRDLLESGAAKYLFPLDVDSANLAVPADVYASKYEQLPREEILPALLREPTLVAIYLQLCI